MKKDEQIDPDTAPIAEIRALPYLRDAIYMSCTFPLLYWSTYRRGCWTNAVDRLSKMEQL